MQLHLVDINSINISSSGSNQKRKDIFVHKTMLSAVLPVRQHCGKHLTHRIFNNFTTTRHMSTMIPSWATYDPYSAGSKGKEIYAVPNLVDGQWSHDSSKQTMSIIDPLDKDKGPIFTICDTQEDEIQPFIDSLRKVPKSGLHNPLKKPERYLQYGDISRKVRQHNSFLLLTKIRQNESSHTFFF